jgi:hypothetical protein
MPNGLLTDKYKGKAFGEIAKDIQAKYKDRFDPISKKGLMSEMSALKEQQEYQKANTEAKEMLDQVLQQQKMAQLHAMMGQDPMQQNMGMQQDASMQPQMGMEQPQQMEQPPVSNMGISPEMPQQDMGNFQRAASQSYNEQFAYGGTMDYYGGGGILSNTADLIDFFQALFQGKIFDNQATLALMLQPGTYPVKPKLDYGMGMFKLQVNNMDAYCHSGFWGTQVLYIPKLNVYLAANYSGGWGGSAVAPIFEKVLNEMEAATPSNR